MSATVGENRALRDRFNVLQRELAAIQDRYQSAYSQYQSGGATPELEAEFKSIIQSANDNAARFEAIRRENSINTELFDPTLGQRAEQNANTALQVRSDAVTAENFVANQVASETANSTNTQSAATTVSQDDAGATQDPAGAPQTLTAAGRIEPGSVETGTNAPTRTLVSTQSVSPTNPPGINDNADARPGGAPGAGAGNDDSGTRSNTQQIIKQATSAGTGRINPQPNVLDQYASYTYNIGWYIMPPDAYKNLLQSKKKNIASYQLLMQSGGAPVNQGGQQPSFTQNGQTDPADAAGPAAKFSGENSGRNPFFPLDYYFDNLEMTSKISGKGTNRAHNVATLKFTVTEPNGITLLDNLYRAVQDVYKNVDTPYSAAQYCLVIRFYGYDANGMPVQVGKDINSSTKPSAVVEKFIPFRISNITFRVANRLVEYQVSGIAIPYSLAFATDLGTIKSNIEVTGGTVQEVMTAGKAPPASPSPDDGRRSGSPIGSGPAGTTFPAAPDDLNIGVNSGVGGMTIDEINVSP